MVICLERGADLHMAQLMPLPLTVSCFSKIQIGFTFLVPAHPGSPGKKAVKCVCACVCLCVCVCVCVCVMCTLCYSLSVLPVLQFYHDMLHCRSELRSVCSATTHADNVALPAPRCCAAIDRYLLSAGPQQQSLRLWSRLG